MPRVLVTALAHKDAARLDRFVRSIEAQRGFHFDFDLKIVINSKDPSFAASLANVYPYEIIVTESNGMPGKGKNSVIDLFRQRKEYDYLIMIDGDDCLYPCAFEQFGILLSQKPDIIGLQTNDAVELVERDNLRVKIGPRAWLYSWFDRMDNWHADATFMDATNRTRNLGQQTTPDRIVFISRKVVDFDFRCSEKLPVYEDYVLSLHAQYLYLRYGLRYFQTSTTYIYLYDKANNASTCKIFDKDHNGNWGAYDDVFREEISWMEPVLGDFHCKDVPFLTVKKPTWFDSEDKIAFIKKMGFF